MSFASRLAEPVRPLSDRIIDGAIVACALWTATCHAVMLLGGNVHTLAWATGGVAAAALLACGWSWRRRRAASEQGAQPATADAEELGGAPGVPDLRSTVVLFALAAAVIVPFLVFRQPLLLWGSSIAYSAVACVLSARTPPPPARRVEPRRVQEIVLFALAALCAFLALYGHRWRNDDCYYINLAVTMVDHPDQPLLSINTIHAPDPESPRSAQVFVPYRVHSFEALGGLISHLTGVEAISVIHLWLAPLFAALLPLALARLLRLLDPARWFYMVLAALCLFFFEGSSGLGFANQGIVRMFTGKSVLLSVVVPLLGYHGLAFGLAPSRARFGLLLAAQISAVGMSSTALWLAPVVAMLAVAAPLRPSRAALRPLLFGLLSCVYVLALAFWVRAQLMAAGAPASADDAGTAGAALAVHESAFTARVGLVNYWLRRTFEVPRVIQASLGVLLLAIPASRTLLARRYMALFGLALVLLFVNPYIAEFMRHNVLGAFTGQRGLWIAPLPAAVAIVFTALLPAQGGWRRRAPALLGMAVALGLFFYFVPTRAVFSRANDVVFRWPPQPRVPSAAWELGRRLSRELPKGSLVLAPEVVSWYLPTVHDHAFPLLANAKYLRESGSEEKRRERLVKWVSDYQADFSEREQEKLTDQLAHYGVAAVVVTRGAARNKDLVGAIKRAGFTRKKANVPGYRLYMRRDLVLNSGG